MRGDVREASGVGERFSCVRGLLLAGILAVGLLLGGCGGNSEEEASVETSEETTEETTQETTASNKSEQASAPKAKNELTDVNCAGFGSPGGAEQFFATSATPEQKEALDPNGNGIPCDEAGNKANPQNKAPGGGPKVNPNVEPAIGLLGCQLREVEEDLGPVEAERFADELVEEVTTRDTNIQTLLAERGYTCGGLAADVLGQ